MIFSRNPWMRGLSALAGALALASCSSTVGWLNEDPATADAAGDAPESAYDIVSRLGTEKGAAEKPAPEARSKPAPGKLPESPPAVVEKKPEAAPKPPPNDEVDLSTLDLSGDFPTARKASREGHVHSPYNDRTINVKGIPSGSLVADPRFPLGERKYFLVP